MSDYLKALADIASPWPMCAQPGCRRPAVSGQDYCPDCRDNRAEEMCELCDKRPASPRCEEGLYCTHCIELREEAACEEAQEAQFTRYWEGEGPLTASEELELAWKAKREAKG